MGQRKKVVIAAGGTGGHLFPAQAVAEALMEQDVDLCFAAAGLRESRYFDRDRFPFVEIESATLFGKKRSLWKAPFVLLKGVWKALFFLAKERPDMVIGFGSFHAFSVLASAFFKRIPIVLFEPNVISGKVNRLFRPCAKMTALQFKQSSDSLQKAIAEVRYPFYSKRHAGSATREEALSYFSLSAAKRTLLVFGGSQGAKSINQLLQKSIPLLQERAQEWQLLHFTGSEESAAALQQEYRKAGLQATVKSFEQRIDLAWRAADCAICRSGASTLAEQIFYGVPALLIPFPYATDDHQTKNAVFMRDVVGGAIVIDEKNASAEDLFALLSTTLLADNEKRGAMQESLRRFANRDGKEELVSLVMHLLKR